MRAAMMEGSRAVFDDLWRAYAEGRIDDALRLIDPDCELRLAESDVAYRGHDGVRALVADSRRDWKTLTVRHDEVREVGERCVVGIGHAVASGPDGATALDRPLAWVGEFRAGRLVRGTAFPDAAAALRYAVEASPA
jgi:ketosteroid isomerase-like protein